MKILGKIGLTVNGNQKYFNADALVKDIFNYISENVHSVEDMLAVGVNLRFDDIEDTEASDLEIAERYEEKENNNVDLIYNIPKKLAFTQRFQDRIKYDIPNVIESVYSDCKVVNTYWVDDDSEGDNIKLVIMVNFTSEDSTKYSKHLDENVKYAIDDIINYYNR